MPIKRRLDALYAGLAALAEYIDENIEDGEDMASLLRDAGFQADQFNLGFLNGCLWLKRHK
jgi:hypothetical protein